MIPKHVFISRGVAKLGAGIPSVNLPAGITCRPDAPCRKLCYARRGRFAYPVCKTRHQTNLDTWNTDPVQYRRDIVIGAFQSRFFRWHCTGDIPDPAYLAMMADVADALPATNFLAFTKQHEIVNEYLNTHRLPNNLKLVLSVWGDCVPLIPHSLPMAFIRFKSGAVAPPPTALACRDYCGDCVITGQSCWDMNPGDAVCFEQH